MKEGILGTIITPAKVFPVAKAQELAAQLTAGSDEGWTYQAKPEGSGAVVEVLDEAGFLAGYL